MGQFFVSMSVGSQRRLMRLSDVREVVSLMALAVSSGEGAYRGMANVRGEMISVFDLAGGDAKLSPSRVVVLVASGNETIGLIADDVLDVLDVDDRLIADKPIGGGRTRTVVRLDDEIFHVMEPADVLQSGS